MFHTIEEIIEDLRAGKNIILVDDEDRENEGDLICAAEFATPENINFMATYGKGLICLPMSKAYTEKFDLPPMSPDNTDLHGTAFTVSIDHVETTTGISAYERSLTAVKIVDEDATARDFRRPGHMFPLEANDGGVLVRDGHTEATIDLMRLAGLKEAGICVEIMKDDGTMARRDDLMVLAEEHDLKIGTIADLIDYRKMKEILIHPQSEAKLPTTYGNFNLHVYEHEITGENHLALVMGGIDDGEPVLCRIHSECLTGDVFHSVKCDCGEQLDAAMEEIAKEGRGVIIYMRQEGRGIGLINKIRAYALQDQGHDTIEANVLLGLPVDSREYYEAKQIFDDLEVSKLRLMTNNPLKLDSLEKYGLEITERVPLQMKAHPANEDYLRTKQEKMKHLLSY